MKKYFIVALLTVIVFSVSQGVYSQERYSTKMAESIMTRNSGSYGSWDYVTGTVLRGFEDVWRATGDVRYYNYIKSTVDDVIGSEGVISDYSMTKYNIDEIKEGCAVLLLYKQTGEDKYKIAVDKLREQLAGHPRTTIGGFWHKEVYPWQMWLDGLYMGSPFYADYSLFFNYPEDFSDVVLQITEMDIHSYDKNKKLHYHGWDESKSQSWADPVTGLSKSFWGRAIGWYAMAIVDVLDYLPENHPERDTVLEIFSRLAEGLKLYQDPSSKVWWQVVDEGGRDSNYIESSASCMFVYALAKAVRLGYIDDSYKTVAIEGYQGILDNFIKKNPNGTLDLTSGCLGAGLSDSRDGTYAYYTIGTVIGSNDGKGLGPFLSASIEIELMDSIYPPGNLRVDSLASGKNYLRWKDNSPKNNTGFLLERKSDAGFAKIAVLSAGTNTYLDTLLSSFTEYQYRIRAYTASDTSLYSNVVSVTSLHTQGFSSPAANPFPTDNSSLVRQNIQLKWDAGQFVSSHDIYFGKTNPPPFVGNSTENSYNPSTLDSEQKYYWRVDEVNAKGTTEGTVWAFTTGKKNELVGFWKFDETSGSTISDSSKYHNHGSTVNMTVDNWVSGASGNALSFNGTNQYASVPHDSAFDFSTGSFTVCFYLQQDITDLLTVNEYRYIIKGSVNYNIVKGTSGKRYEVYFKPSVGEIRFAIDDNVNKSQAAAEANLFVTGSWVHVAVVRDVTKNKLFIYANGELAGETNDVAGDISQNENLIFGTSELFLNCHHGLLDEIQMYNYALDTSDIKQVISGSFYTRVENKMIERKEAILYPNPAKENLSISLPENTKNGNIYIYNNTGKLVRSVNAASSNTTLNIFDLNAGLYYVMVVSDKNIKSEKLIVTK